ncbi:MAG: sulfatase [Verrucomicrobiales bacterium]|nr:sulfatase [Verrucomicrobiales bacterium]
MNPARIFLPLFAAASLTSAVADDRPNILFILADDLGWRDLACYGNKFYETPNLDRLSEEGMRFTQAYAPAPICSASRAAFLTGKTPARLGFEFVTKNEPGFQPVDASLRAPAFTLNLSTEEKTIAEVLAEAGYETAFFGKWHLNRHHGRYLGWSPTHGPPAQGFLHATEDFGSHPYSYWNKKEQRKFSPKIEHAMLPEDGMTGHAIRFLRGKHERPFFLMVSHFWVHTPVHTRAKWLHDRVLKRIPDTHPRRGELAQYGAMVETLDHHVGELLAALKAAGLEKNTLVVFTSDNGGHPEYFGNAPLRGSKWNLYEGGIRVPFLVRLSAVIPPGTICETPVAGVDLLPTFAEVAEAAEADLPSDLDGKSILPLLQKPDAEFSERDLFWHFPYYHPEGKKYDDAPEKIGIDDGFTSKTKPNSVIRSGPWKLIRFYESGVGDELYHLPADLSEQKNRAASEPEIFGKLRGRLDAYLNQCGARMPVPNPAWQKND